VITSLMVLPNHQMAVQHAAVSVTGAHATADIAQHVRAVSCDLIRYLRPTNIHDAQDGLSHSIYRYPWIAGHSRYSVANALARCGFARPCKPACWKMIRGTL
jgi:hypothetical protein